MYCAANLKWTKKEEKRIFRHSIKNYYSEKKNTQIFTSYTLAHFKTYATNKYVRGSNSRGWGGGKGWGGGGGG